MLWKTETLATDIPKIIQKKYMSFCDHVYFVQLLLLSVIRAIRKELTKFKQFYIFIFTLSAYFVCRLLFPE